MDNILNNILKAATDERSQKCWVTRVGTINVALKNTMFLLLRSYNFTRTKLNGTGHWFRNFMRIIVIYSQQMIIIYFNCCKEL